MGGDTRLPDSDRKTWNEFCAALEQREGEVAVLYDQKLYDFRGVARRNASLDAIKLDAELMSQQLVAQKAMFDLLAERARGIRRQLD